MSLDTDAWMTTIALSVLTLKVPIMTAADDIHKYFFHCFSEKIRLDVSCESSARWRIHMKNQALLSWKDKIKKIKCHLQFLFGTLRGKYKQAKTEWQRFCLCKLIHSR